MEDWSSKLAANQNSIGACVHSGRLQHIIVDVFLIIQYSVFIIICFEPAILRIVCPWWRNRSQTLWNVLHPNSHAISNNVCGVFSWCLFNSPPRDLFLHLNGPVQGERPNPYHPSQSLTQPVLLHPSEQNKM